MAQVLITNVYSKPLSLDFSIDGEEIRENLAVGESVDVGDRVAIDDVNQNTTVKAMVAAGRITVTSAAEADDVAADIADGSVVTDDLAALAVTTAKIDALAVTAAKLAALAVTTAKLDDNAVTGPKMDLMQSVLLGAPIVATADHLYAAADWGDGSLTPANTMDVPRNVTATLTDANNSVSGLLTITGTDPAGNTVVETMAPDAAGGGKTLTGTKIFASITSMVISGTGGTVDVGVDQLVIGVGNVIGLPNDIQVATAVKHVYLGGDRQASPTVTAGVSTSGVDASAGTYDGSKLLQVVYNVGE